MIVWKVEGGESQNKSIPAAFMLYQCSIMFTTVSLLAAARLRSVNRPVWGLLDDSNCVLLTPGCVSRPGQDA